MSLCAGHVYRGGLKASGGTCSHTPPPTSAPPANSTAGSSAGVVHEMAAKTPAAQETAAKVIITPAALKVMDSGGPLPGIRDADPVPNRWQPYHASPQWLCKHLCNTKLVGFANWFCKLVAGDVNAFLKEASMMQRLADCPQVGGARLLAADGGMGRAGPLEGSPRMPRSLLSVQASLHWRWLPLRPPLGCRWSPYMARAWWGSSWWWLWS